eukprot:3765929-Amphidinium_carterae.1
MKRKLIGLQLGFPAFNAHKLSPWYSDDLSVESQTKGELIVCYVLNTTRAVAITCWEQKLFANVTHMNGLNFVRSQTMDRISFSECGGTSLSGMHMSLQSNSVCRIIISINVYQTMQWK